MATRPTTSRPDKELVGAALHPNAAIQQEYVSTILALIRRMAEEVKREMVKTLERQALDGAAMDENVSVSARVALNALTDKYETLFNRVAKKATRRMMARTLKNSSVTLGMSLRELAPNLNLKTDILNDRLKEVISASTTEAASLIKLIPQKYLGDVQGAVMRSITTGNGLADLLPYLNQKYDQNIRHARNVAMDQTRKAYTSINRERMKAVGVKQFKWLHIGGSQHPREDHVAMSGKVYSLDDPPYIGTMGDKKVYGFPGTLPYCRCVMRPVISFEE